jgi:hypothetical protein
MKYIVFIVSIFILQLPLSVSAETVLRIGENISVDADQVVDGDYYVSVGPLGNTTMSGSITQDMYAFGASVSTNGTIGNDLTIISGESLIHGSVADDVRIVSGEAIIADHVGGDLFVIAGSLKVLSSATIAGDVIFFGGTAVINGEVGGSVLGTAEKIDINANVAKDVDVTVGSVLTFGDKSHIEGAVRYTSPQALVRTQNASIAGDIVRNEGKADTLDSKAKVQDMLVPVFITLFATLSLYLLFRKRLELLVGTIQKKPLKSFVLGISVLVLGPIVSILLIATVLGSVLGIICLALVMLLYATGIALCGVVLGGYISKLLIKKSVVSLPWVLLGTVLIFVLLWIPILGFIAFLYLMSVAIGSLVLNTYNSLT